MSEGRESRENRESRKRKANSQNIDANGNGRNPFPHYNSNENASQVPWELEHWRRNKGLSPPPLKRPPRRKTPTPPPTPPPQTPRRRRKTPPPSPPNNNSNNNAYAYNFNTSNAQPDEFKLRRLREKHGDKYIMDKYGIDLKLYLGLP